jgi:hypothetical protein
MLPPSFISGTAASVNCVSENALISSAVVNASRVVVKIRLRALHAAQSYRMNQKIELAVFLADSLKRNVNFLLIRDIAWYDECVGQIFVNFSTFSFNLSP